MYSTAMLFRLSVRHPYIGAVSLRFKQEYVYAAIGMSVYRFVGAVKAPRFAPWYDAAFKLFKDSISYKLVY